MSPYIYSIRPSANTLPDAINRIRLRRFLAAFGLAACSVGMAYAASGFDEEFDDPDKPWQEIAIQLPATPLPENLLPFYVSPIATQSFAIDAKSLSVGTDGVVRYTLVTTSASGAKNISYEGIRCISMEKKLYAFGHADGAWSRSRRDQWERIPLKTANRQHATLAEDYLCDGGMIAGDAAQIVERIRRAQRIRFQ